MKSLEQIGKKYGCDKITHHGYHRFYEQVLQDLRKKKIKMLEIGIEHEKSLKMWLEYFPKAFVYGIDKDLKKKGKRFQVFKCRQEDTRAIKELFLEDLDFILDDGSHVPEHQLSSFNHLFPFLNPGGIYIIEDVETSYWTSGDLYGYKVRSGYKEKNSIVEIMKGAADEINKEFLHYDSWMDHNETHPMYQDVRKDIATITFGQNCVIIRKKDSSYEKFDDRKYRWTEKGNAVPKVTVPGSRPVIYQSFFDDHSKRSLDAGFIPYDNSGKLTDLYENGILIDIFKNRKKEWTGSSYTGLLSWRFFEKSNLKSDQVLPKIKGDKDVYLLTPKQYIGKFKAPLSPTGFGPVLQIAINCDRKNLFPFKLYDYDAGDCVSFCNFFLARPEIFSDYIENYLLKAVNFLRSSTSPELKLALATKVMHRGRQYDPIVFFLEGLFQCYVHYNKISYGYILSEEPAKPVHQANPISQMRADLLPVGSMDHIFAKRALQTA